MTTQARPDRTAARRWTLHGAAAAGWVGAYALNEVAWTWLYGTVFGLDITTGWASMLHFFSYDTIKITLLLTGIIFVVTVLRSFMSIERTRALLGGKREGVGNVCPNGSRDDREHHGTALCRNTRRRLHRIEVPGSDGAPVLRASRDREHLGRHLLSCSFQRKLARTREWL